MDANVQTTSTCMINVQEMYYVHKRHLKGQCRHDQSRLSTWHGIGVLVTENNTQPACAGL